MFDKNKYLKELEFLVNLNCGTYNKEGVNNIINYLKSRLTSLNFSCKTITVDSKVGDFLYATNTPNRSNYDAVLIAHLDTVYNAVDFHYYPFKLDEKNNLAYGLGVSDMKAGVLSIIYSIESLSQEELDKLSICLIFNPDEEISSIYSKSHIKEIAKDARCILVTESSESSNTLVNQRKGIARYKCIFNGIASHGSTPYKGASSILEASNFILSLERFNKQDSQTTTNTGYIKGDGLINVVPDFTEIGFEIRFNNIDEYNLMHKEIFDLTMTPKNSSIKIKIEQLSFTPPLYNKDAKWLEDIALLSAKAANLDLHFTSSNGATDGNHLSLLGIPVLDGLGPYGNNFHNKEKEYLDFNTVSPRITLITNILKNLISL